MKVILALCGAALVAGCSSVPMQKVESNATCDYALMQRVEGSWQPTLTARYWVNCPQVKSVGAKSS